MVTQVKPGRKKTPRLSYVVATLEEVAEFFGVTRQAVQQWKLSGDPMPFRAGEYDLSKIAQWFRRQRDGSNLSEELKAADIRLKTVQAQQKELDLEIQKGELIPLADVERWAATALIEMREIIMTLPETIATSTPPDMREFVRTEVDENCRDALLMLQRRLEENVDDDDSTATDSAA